VFRVGNWIKNWNRISRYCYQ